MKAFYRSLVFIAAAAMTFISCEREIENPEAVDGVKMKTITISSSIADTKTTLDANHTNLLWSSGDKVSLFNNVNNTNTELTYASGGDITVSVPDGTTEIYMHYPYYSGNTSGPTSASVYIAANQTQENPGELNGYYYPMVAKGTVDSNNKALVEFYPVAGALALNLYHSGIDGSNSITVESVTVTPAAANTGFVGSQSTDITADNVVYSSTSASTTSVTVTLTNGLVLGNTAPSDKQKFNGQIYVCLAKQSYASVKFDIVTDQGNYSITSNTTPFDLVNNDFVPVNINLNKAAHEEPFDPTANTWELVTSSIAVGDKVVFASADASDNLAMSTTQSGNNRGVTSVSISGTTLTATADVQAFEVVAGTADGSFGFKCLNGNTEGDYIYAASSSSNYLRSQSSLNANASWSVSITSAGVATVVAQGSNTRNTIRYNSGNSIFSCYGSSSTQNDIAIYKVGAAADPNAKTIMSAGNQEDLDPAGGTYNISGAYTTNNIDENTEALTVTSSSNVTNVTVLGGDIEFDMAPNYTKSTVDGTITITLASDNTVTATINLQQAASSLSTSTTEVIIPYNSDDASFTVTSKHFPWNIVTDDDSHIVFTESGAKADAASTVDITCDLAATDAVQTVCTLTVYRNNNAEDPQKVQVVVKKAATPSLDAKYYNKVSAISDGTYLICNASAGRVITGYSSNYMATATVSIASDKITSDETVNAYACTITALTGDDDGYYTIKYGTSYIGYNTSTKFKTSTTVDDAFKWSITFNSDGTAKIVNKSAARFWGYYASNNQFRAYATSNDYPCPTLFKYSE